MKHSNYFSKFKKVTLLLMATLAIAACGKKGNSGTQAPGYPIYPGGCATCAGGIGGALLDNVKFQYGRYTNYFDGILQITGQDNGSANMSDVKAIVAFQGNIAVSGYMNINNPNALCGAQPGTYTIQTVTPGISNRGALQGLSFIATGPSQITFQGSGSVYADPNIQPNYGVYRGSLANRVGMDLYMTVNGAPCGTVSTY